jgi:uncharacterized protein YfaS (alpha-2-macroglobulin family)
LKAISSGDLVLVRLTLVLPEGADFLVIADPLPAGLEAIQLDFLTSGASLGQRVSNAVTAPGHAPLDPDYTEIRDREVRAFFGHVGAGVREYRYVARAVTPGRFAAPRARAELMYHPEVAAFTDGPYLMIRP